MNDTLVPRRLKIMKALRRLPRHRYDLLRLAGIGASILILFVVPLSGLARIDLWAGRHRLLFGPAAFKPALAGVILGVSAMYVVTFLSNVVAGRMFCGWGCPVGQISRFGEILDTPGQEARRRRTAFAKSLAFAFAFTLSMLAWWVDLRVLWRGGPAAIAATWGILAGGTILGHLHGRFWRWDFCRRACPIGLYYTFMSPAKHYGIHFRNQHETCIECDACDNVCPVHLAPRDLATPIPSPGGFSIENAPGRNHCLECGDCVRACEWMVGLKGMDPVPLLLGIYRGPQRIDAPARPAGAASAGEGR